GSPEKAKITGLWPLQYRNKYCYSAALAAYLSVPHLVPLNKNTQLISRVSRRVSAFSYDSAGSLAGDSAEKVGGDSAYP
ncbi:MAG TPA: hypothetical protein VGB56_04310, partial [Flavisolibacter sp.]